MRAHGADQRYELHMLTVDERSLNRNVTADATTLLCDPQGTLAPA